MPHTNDARVRKLNPHPANASGEYVVYWSQMVRRLTHHHALDYAVSLAKHYNKPLVVYEGLKLNYPWASARIHQFMLEGMRDNAATAKTLGVNYWPFVETPDQTGRGLLRTIAEKAVVVVSDDYPAYIVPAQNQRVAASVKMAFHVVDANGIVPLANYGKPVSAAAHLRPRMHKLFADSWANRALETADFASLPKLKAKPPFELWKPPADLSAFVASLPIDQSVTPLANFEGGATAGRAILKKFVAEKLNRYGEHRSLPDDPRANAASGLSPYLHFGYVSMDEVVDALLATVPEWSDETLNLKTRNKDDFFSRDANINGFLDEAITWRDIGFHWHYHRMLANESKALKSWQDPDESPAFNFETMDFQPLTHGTLATTLPDWAKASLSKHEADRREYEYTLEQLETATTHDELWNAAQQELIHSGRMHNYLRMLWGKKVLEWSPSPEEAYRRLEHLNNKYAIDGRDPNSYTGILWCFGLFDRPWPPERQVFGSIRFMSSTNTAKKYKLANYYAYVRRLISQSTVPGTPRATSPPVGLF